uniref:Thioredoxin domain-containing protein n=1 Tax=Oncorhynchus tshawytscha TaxID=74940 RepID=A0AAZ3QMY9_ONCTS
MLQYFYVSSRSKSLFMLWPRRAGLMSGVYKPSPSGFVTLHPGNCLLLQECAVTLRTVNMIIVIDDKGLSEKPENSNVVFLKVDVDDAADVAQHCDIKCMPTFHFYKNGGKVDDFSGANQATLEEKIKALRS